VFVGPLPLVVSRLMPEGVAHREKSLERRALPFNFTSLVKDLPQMKR
jgi:hypothetical protein